MKKLFIFILLFGNYCFSNGLGNNYFAKSDISFYSKTNYNDNILLSTDRNFLLSTNESKLIDCDIRQFIPEFDTFKYEGLNFQSKTAKTLLSNSLLSNGGSSALGVSKWSQVDKVAFSVITASLVGIGIYAHNNQMSAWWKDRGSFEILNDLDYACQLDKIGHGFVAMTISRTVTELYTYTGVERRTSLLIGTICGLGWQTYVEIMDGFGTSWGFSPSDFISDVIGVSYPVAQEYYKPLRNFNIKHSYYPSIFLTTDDPRDEFIWADGHISYEPAKKNNFSEDYAGQMFWLSVNIYEYLPKKIQRYWPEWLSIAAGYGLSKWNGAMESYGHRVTDRELWLSFDYNLEELPGDTKFLIMLKRILNQIHFPAPAVRLTPSVIWYGLFYAHIV